MQKSHSNKYKIMETPKVKDQILRTMPCKLFTKKHTVSFSNSFDNNGNEYFRMQLMFDEWEFPLEGLIGMANDQYPNGFVLNNADNPSEEDYLALQEDIIKRGTVFVKKRADGERYISVALVETGFGTAKRKAKPENDADDTEDVLPVEEKVADKKKVTAKTK